MLKLFTRNKIFEIAVDVIYFIFLSALFCFYAFLMYFPTIRAYMLVGVLVGLLLYFKSFHILLAKCAKKIYNITKKTFLKVKNDRIKVKKNDSRVDRRRSAFVGVSIIGYDLSTSGDRKARKRSCRIKRKDRTISSND